MKQNEKQIDTWKSVKHNKHYGYHVGQYGNPYRSTVFFFSWLIEQGLITPERPQTILDAGCGGGANTCHIARRCPESRFVGFDINPDLVALGGDKLAELGIGNVDLRVGDIYAPDPAFNGRFDGVVCLQTLSWLPSFRDPMRALARIDADWIAASSMFFDGNIDATIMTKDYTMKTETSDYNEQFYNVYSLTQARKTMAELGYGDFRFVRFDIDVDLPKPTDGGFGTYTETLSDGRRIQVSGPVLMSWHFIAARKTGAPAR